MVFWLSKLKGWLVTTVYCKCHFKNIKYFNSLYCCLNENWTAQLLNIKVLTSSNLRLKYLLYEMYRYR